MPVDNPFGEVHFPPTPTPSIEPIKNTTPTTFNEPPTPVVVEPPKPVKPTANQKKIIEILAEYNNTESDIPVNHPEYWYLKGQVQADANR